MENKRWYDQDATVSLAISLIKNSNETTQAQCANFIKEKAQDYGVVLKTNLLGVFNYVLNRWYDTNEQLSEAFDYLKDAEPETRKQISVDIINFLQSAEIKK